MKAHIGTVINSRTRGLAPMMMGNLSDEDSNHHTSDDESVESEDGELYRLEIRSGKKVFFLPNPDMTRAKATPKVDGRVKPTKNFPLWTQLVTSERIAGPRLKLMEDTRIPHPKEKVQDVARKKIQKHHKMSHWGQLTWGPLKCC